MDDQNNPANKKCEIKKICDNIRGSDTPEELCKNGYVNEPETHGCVMVTTQSGNKYCYSFPRCELIDRDHYGADEGFCSGSYYDRKKEICIFVNDPGKERCEKKTFCSSTEIADCSSGYVTKGEKYKCDLDIDGKSCVEKEECNQVTNPSETNCSSGYVSDSKKECKFNATNNKCEEKEKVIDEVPTTVPQANKSNNSKMLELSLAFISLFYL